MLHVALNIRFGSDDTHTPCLRRSLITPTFSCQVIYERSHYAIGIDFCPGYIQYKQAALKNTLKGG